MKIAVMQPYFFPYYGYFELIDAVDVFVFFQDVQYTRRGWINRNKLSNDIPIVVPVKKPSFTASIQSVEIDTSQDWHTKHIAKLSYIYGKKATDHPVFEYYKKLNQETNLNELLKKTIKNVCSFLGITTTFRESSEFPSDLKKTNRIIDICKKLNATTYINASGGRSLYDSGDFEEQGIKLEFMNPCSYPNKSSILDVLFRDGLNVLKR